MKSMDIHQVIKRLPHRYPFLLVDRVLELEDGKRIKALKNVTINEPFFVGHFPNRPVEPGDQLIMEATMERARAGIYKFHAKASVDGELVCEADLMCTIRKVES